MWGKENANNQCLQHHENGRGRVFLQRTRPTCAHSRSGRNDGWAYLSKRFHRNRADRAVMTHLGRSKSVQNSRRTTCRLGPEPINMSPRSDGIGTVCFQGPPYDTLGKDLTAEKFAGVENP